MLVVLVVRVDTILYAAKKFNTFSTSFACEEVTSTVISLQTYDHLFNNPVTILILPHAGIVLKVSRTMIKTALTYDEMNTWLLLYLCGRTSVKTILVGTF